MSRASVEKNQDVSSGHGGRRPGAGRKPGSVTQRTRDIAEGALGEGLTPLDYMLKLLRDEDREEAVRFEAAKAAAPYCHAKLAAIDVSAEHDMTDRLAALMGRIDGKSRPLVG